MRQQTTLTILLQKYKRFNTKRQLSNGVVTGPSETESTSKNLRVQHLPMKLNVLRIRIAASCIINDGNLLKCSRSRGSGVVTQVRASLSRKLFPNRASLP